MRTFRYTFAALAALCAGLASCVKDNTEPVPVPEVYEQGFSLGTRAGEEENEPAHGDAFTLLAYRMAYSSSTTAYSTQITFASGVQQYGYYAYDKSGAIGNAGDLIPVAVSSVSPYGLAESAFKRQQDQGLRLVGTPLTGANANNTGFYNVAMIHPAIPVRNTSDHGYLAVFNHTDDIYASHPLDRNGDGTPTDSFGIEVQMNGQVHPVADDVKLFPVKAAIRVYLYSHFYKGETPEPSEIAQSVTFTATDTDAVKLVNAGSNGWFNPCTGIIYPNYNYGSNYGTIYSSILGGAEGTNAESLIAAVNTETIPTSYSGETATAKYLIDNVRVFPTDYRGAEGGGNPFIIPMTLSLKLKQDNDVYNKASVPIALNIENNKVYTFYVNVKSTMIQVSYTISEWVSAGGVYDNIGGNVMEYMTVKLQNLSGDWTGQNGGSETIGGYNN